ncbi:electron transfer flavoprotein subunit beta [Kosmotoga arenicorallina S304]|uniref:Electron transfer flavoprotein subunit beta n=1 Tax=Kosmotoga arenicorallina S304 TaxID=1453497 RepID=A0A176K4M0_9BACT|nr:electron transfer flavoprotein subunit beta/FixA family protein [Kosmotoga arenicorallina]OAA32522.1 electron transfer flavoprotein subunit beta [Kosmotoga arenicorallina S304]
MRIAVLVKQVPDTDLVKLDPETGTMIRENTGNIINPLDLHAIEAALRIKEFMSSETDIVAFSMGPPVAEVALREAIAMGVNDAYLISDRRFAGADTLATATVLSKALEEFGPFDLVLAGEKAVDGETGQVGPEVGAILDLPVLSYVAKIVEFTEKSIIIEREVEDGKEIWESRLPCLLTLTKEVNEPRLPTLNMKKKARRVKIKTLNCDSLKIDETTVGLKGSPTRVAKITTPKIARNAVIYEGKELEEGIWKVIELLKPYLEENHE